PRPLSPAGRGEKKDGSRLLWLKPGQERLHKGWRAPDPADAGCPLAFGFARSQAQMQGGAGNILLGGQDTNARGNLLQDALGSLTGQGGAVAIAAEVQLDQVLQPALR